MMNLIINLKFLKKLIIKVKIKTKSLEFFINKIIIISFLFFNQYINI
jgi:hypothetical protein